MISEKKVRIMTKLAIYEKNHEPDMKISRYYKSDYIRYYLLRTILNVTLAYFLLLVLIALYNINSFITKAVEINYSKIGMYILIVYIAFIVTFTFISFFVYSSRYAGAKKRLSRYYKKLKVLNKLYKDDRQGN